MQIIRNLHDFVRTSEVAAFVSNAPDACPGGRTVEKGPVLAALTALWLNAALATLAAWSVANDLAAPIAAVAALLAGAPTLAARSTAFRSSLPWLATGSLAVLANLLVWMSRMGSVPPDWTSLVQVYLPACMAFSAVFLNRAAIVSFAGAALTSIAAMALCALFGFRGFGPDLLGSQAILLLEAACLVWSIGTTQRRIAMAGGKAAAAQADAGRKATAVLEAEAACRIERDWRHSLELRSAELEARLSEVLALLDDQFGRMHDTARMLNTVAGETIRQVSTAEEAAMLAQTYVGEVARAAGNLAEAEREITTKVQATSAVTRQATTKAADVEIRVVRLADAAKRIEDVVRTVETIAASTNLLALNATIEAARAGQAGRGFAVVAQEVKTLAARTATCTASIGELATSIRSAAEGALAAVAVITGVMDEIDASTQIIAGAVEEQGVATARISDHSLLMQRGTDTVVTAVNEATGAAAETTVAAIEVEHATRAVAAAVRDLSRELNDFAANIRQNRSAA